MAPFKYRAFNTKLNIIRQVSMIQLDSVSGNEFIQVWDHPSVEAAKIKGRVDKWNTDDCILIPSTGLKDKKGVDIYCDDWLMMPELYETPESTPCGYIFDQVVWLEDYAAFGFENNGVASFLYQEIESYDGDVEVVGSILMPSAIKDINL